MMLRKLPVHCRAFSRLFLRHRHDTQARLVTAKDLLDRELAVVSEEDVVLTALEKMRDTNTCALAVTDTSGENLVGIVTERDYLKKIRHEKDPEKKCPVWKVMTSFPIGCLEATPVVRVGSSSPTFGRRSVRWR